MALVFVLLSLLAQARQRPASLVREHVDRAHALLKAGKTPEALAELRELLRSHPDDPEAQFEAGSILQELAGATFERLERLAPDSAETHELLGKYHEARGELLEALSEYRLAMRGSAGRGLHFLAGNVLWKQRDFDAAVSELEAELRMNPNHSMASHRLGNIYMARNEVARAIPLLETAVRGEPAFLEGRRDLAKAYRLSGRFNEALEQLSFVAEERPDDDSVHAQLAAVYRALGNSEKAKAELKLHRELLQKRSEAAQRNQ